MYKILSNESNFGIKFEYKLQENPNGLAEAFIIRKEFIGSRNVALIIGDNIFYGHRFSKTLKKPDD